MKIQFTKEWCMQVARLEGDAEIGAGMLAADPVVDTFQSAEHSAEEPSIAFHRLVRLMRRNKRLTLEELAEDIDVEVAELISIEDDPHYRPEPRTVHLLAGYFKLPRGNLMQIAGLMEPKNDKLLEEAVRFAARSEPVAVLTPEERAALEAFVSVLSEQK